MQIIMSNLHKLNNPRLYHKANSMQMKDARQILEEHLDKLTWKSGERVLDIGCGPGNSTVTVLEPILYQDSTIVGCDLSEDMVSYAQEVYGNERRIFKVADISDEGALRALGAQEGNFHKIFSFYCLHWIRDQKQATQNIYKMLKNDGYGIMVFLSYQPAGIMHEIVSKNPLWEPYVRDYGNIISPYHHSQNPAKEYSELLRSCGFEILLCLNRPSAHVFPSVEAYLDMMISVNPFYNIIPEGLRSSYVEEMWSAFRDGQLVEVRESGEVIHTYKLLVAIVRKP